VRDVRRLSNTPQVIEGNVATAEGARPHDRGGGDAIKVGIGPGSIARHAGVAGLGGRITAIVDTVAECRRRGSGDSDGGIKFPAHSPRRLPPGADCAMIGSLSPDDESPGEGLLYQAKLQVLPREGSIGARARGSRTAISSRR